MSVPGIPTGRIQLLRADGDLHRDIAGGKAWSIQNMLNLGIPVPPAFVITANVCRDYHENGRRYPSGLTDELRAAMTALEEHTGRNFASTDRPLLVSVRSGAAVSMPGMMDTVLNLGITRETGDALAVEMADQEFARDTRCRFIEQFEKVVGTAPPEDPWAQLELAIRAVLDSWHSKRAIAYRTARDIADAGGTAVTVQAMVFGNLDHRSGTGVLFSRDPLTGHPEPYGEWLPRGQGEDVVSGRKDALPLDELTKTLPDVHSELLSAAKVLERAGREVQDIEFTVESGKLWLLQSRSAKQSPQAVVRCAVHLQREGLINVDEALDRIQAEHVSALLRPSIEPNAASKSPPAACGKPASPGIATGRVITDADGAERHAEDGHSVVLARPTTDPDDVAAMSMAAAVLTELGGSTSHAAVVCRELAVPCIVGCGIGTVTKLAGQVVTVDADTGTVYLGDLPIVPSIAPDDDDLRTVEGWLRDALGEYDPGISLIKLIDKRRQRIGHP